MHCSKCGKKVGSKMSSEIVDASTCNNRCDSYSSTVIVKLDINYIIQELLKYGDNALDQETDALDLQ